MADKDDDDGAVNASLDEPAAEGEGLEEEGKGGLDAKKILLFIVAPILILVGAGGGLYFSGMLDSVLGKDKAAVEGEHGDAYADAGHDKKAKKGGHGDGHGEEGASVPGGAYFLKIPDMIVNLNTPDDQPRYLRLSIQLELKSSADAASVEAVMPRVIDQFQTYLRELRVRDLRGTAGLYRLQIELLARVNAAAYPIEVQDVLFQEILIQ